MADAGEGFLALDALGDGCVGTTYTHDLIHFRHRKAKLLHGFGYIVFMFDGLIRAQAGIIHLQYNIRTGSVFVCLAVTALADLFPLRQVYLRK